MTKKEDENMKKMTTGQVLKRFFSPVVHNKVLAFWLCFSTAMWGLYGIFNVYMIKVLVADIEQADVQSLQYHIAVYIGVIVFYQLANFLVVRKGYLHHGTMKTLNEMYIEKFVLLDNTQCERYGTGRLITIIQGGIEVRRSLLQELGRSFPEFLIAFIYAIIVIGQISPRYVLWFLLLTIGANGAALILSKFGHKYRSQRYDLEGSYKRSYVKILMSKFEILQNDTAKKEVAVLNQNIDGQRDLDYKKHAFEHIAFNIPDTTVLLLKVGVYFAIGMLVIQGQESLENLLLYVGLLTYVDRTIKSLLDGVVKRAIKKYSAIQSLRNLFDRVPAIQGYDTGKNFRISKGEICLENVTFSYQGAKDETAVLKDFSLVIQGGKKTALVGVSGSGKSTLVKLITGYLTPDQGDVVVDKQPLSSIALKTYYKHIAYLTQEPNVFDGTIYENLTYAVQGDVSQKALREVISLAKCEFVRDLPKGLDTEIGERGIRLSGGQRQRLAIAKVFLKNPEIIVLDEPTSALDSFSEEAITQAMHNLFEGRTVIVIAHRLQTVKEADDIIVLERGKIVERGTNDQLIQQNGAYAKMLALQSGL